MYVRSNDNHGDTGDAIAFWKIFDPVRALTTRRFDPNTHPWQAAIQTFGGRVVDPKQFPANASGFQQYLNATGVKYFSSSEMTSPHSARIARRLGYRQLLPGHEWWPRGAALAKLSDQLRELVNRPVRMRNWWRPRDYNKAVGGAARSDHIAALAVDLDYKFGDDRRQAEQLLLSLRSQHPWLKMSLGLGGRTTHVGLRSDRGERTWYYKSYRR